MTNEEDIHDYLNLKRGNNCSECTIRNQHMILTQFNQFIKGKPFKETTEQDVIAFIQNRRQSGHASSSIKHYTIIIKGFYRWLYELPLHHYPKQVRNLNGGRNKNRLSITPNEVITEEDVAQLLKYCTNYRDQAILVTLYESGARLGEFVNMDLKNLHFDDKGVVIVLKGKTGERRIRLVLSVPYLQEWIEHHPKKGVSLSPLWVTLKMRNGEYNRLSDCMVYIVLQQLKKDSQFTKRTNPHRFRHSRATFLAQFLSDAQMRVFFGWSRGSNMIGRYTHLSGKDMDDKILAISGVETHEEKKTSILREIECIRCGVKNAFNNKFCRLCGLPLHKEEILKEELERGQELEMLRERVEKTEGIEHYIEQLYEKMEEMQKQIRELAS